MDWLPEAGNAPSGSRVQVDGEGSEQLDGREGKLCREPTTNSHGTADKPPGLIQRYRELLQTRHYARRTVKTYEQWLRRFLRFHHLRHPREMGSR